MSGSVIDLIDGVIDRRGDAMRWSPDAEISAEPLVEFNHELHSYLAEFQLAILDHMVPALRAFREALGQSVDREAAEERVRRMHRLYRRRRS